MRWRRGNRLKLVTEAEASGRTRKIFDEVRQSFGVPVVPSLYQAYAVVPEFLETHWEAFRPAVQARQFFMLGARLAAECYTRVHNYCVVAGVPLNAAQPYVAVAPPVHQILDYYQYLDPLLLLVSAAQVQAFEGPIGANRSDGEAALHPEFRSAPALLTEEDASADVRRIWAERRRMVELAFIADEHRALACWPDFYAHYWLALRELMRSPLYADNQYRVTESAWMLARELPARVDTNFAGLLDAGLDDEQIASIARINEAFVQALGGLLLDVTIARIASEGGTRQQAPPQKPSAQIGQQAQGSPTRAA